jgi:hypothetical protein
VPEIADPVQQRYQEPLQQGGPAELYRGAAQVQLQLGHVQPPRGGEAEIQVELGHVAVPACRRSRQSPQAR